MFEGMRGKGVIMRGAKAANCVIAFGVLVAAAMPLAAQSDIGKTSSGTSGGSSDPVCQAAVDRLAETRGDDEGALAIYLSKRCTANRDAFAFDVRDGMDDMAQMLTNEGVDLNRLLRPRLAACENIVNAEMRQTVPQGTPRPVRSELSERCRQNARTAAYAEGVNELQELRQQRFAQETREYENQLSQNAADQASAEKAYEQQLADDRAAYEAQMADWRRRVALCERGNVEYCAE